MNTPRGRDALMELLAKGTPRRKDAYTLVAVDGVDGSGKTTFATDFARALEGQGHSVVVIHADDFLHLRQVRHRRGRDSPEGFWRDSYDYESLVRDVLIPFGPQGDGLFRRASSDHVLDVKVDLPLTAAPRGTTCIVEGMFLHRQELAGYWDHSLFLKAPFAQTAKRMAIRDGTAPDPTHPSMRRYVQGQLMYFAAASPWRQATVVVDNSDSA